MRSRDWSGVRTCAGARERQLVHLDRPHPVAPKPALRRTLRYPPPLVDFKPRSKLRWSSALLLCVLTLHVPLSLPHRRAKSSSAVFPFPITPQPSTFDPIQTLS